MAVLRTQPYAESETAMESHRRMNSHRRCPRGRWPQVGQNQVDVITIDPEIMNGTPCFRGTRVPLKNLVAYLNGGHPLTEFLRQFPTVTHEMTVEALAVSSEAKLYTEK